MMSTTDTPAYSAGFDINGYPLPLNDLLDANNASPNAAVDAQSPATDPSPQQQQTNNNNNYNNEVETYQNLFITKLHRNIKDQDLLALFAPFNGRSATVMLDAKTGRSKGFGFVLFDTEAEGRRAHEAMHQKQITVAGCTSQLSIFPSKHDAKNAVDPSPSLYVRNVPITVPKEEVEQMLEQFGSVAFCAMREEPDGLPVWVILVEYDCQQCADNALSHLRHNTSLYLNGPLPVIAKYAKAMDRKRSLTSRKRQNASKNCPFRAPAASANTRFNPNGSNNNNNMNGNGSTTGGPIGAGGSYGSSFNDEMANGSYGSTIGSDSMGSGLWAAQLSASHHHQQQIIPQYVATTTHPNGSMTTTAYYGSHPHEQQQVAAAAGGLVFAANPMVMMMGGGNANGGGNAVPMMMSTNNGGNPFVGMDPNSLHFQQHQQLGGGGGGAIVLPQNLNNNMFVFQPQPLMGGGPLQQPAMMAPSPFMQPTMAMGHLVQPQHQQQVAVNTSNNIMGGMMPANVNQFVMFAPPPNMNNNNNNMMNNNNNNNNVAAQFRHQ